MRKIIHRLMIEGKTRDLDNLLSKKQRNLLNNPLLPVQEDQLRLQMPTELAPLRNRQSRVEEKGWRSGRDRKARKEDNGELRREHLKGLRVVMGARGKWENIVSLIIFIGIYCIVMELDRALFACSSSGKGSVSCSIMSV